MTKIRVIDFETTGDSPDGDEHGVVEIGFHDVVPTSVNLAGEPAVWEVMEGRSCLCHPGVAIPPDTSAVHHIMDEDVAELANWKSRLRPLIRGLRDDGVTHIAAFGADMEQAFIHPDWWGEAGQLPWIDVYKAALRIWPESPTHKNMGLRYWRRPAGLERAKALPAHRAGPDAYVTAFLLRDLLNGSSTVEQMRRWALEPALTVRCYVGDYRNGGKGTPWAEVDSSFLFWILDGRFQDKPDIRFTARYHLDRREEAEAARQEREELDAQMRENGLPEGPVDDQASQAPAPTPRDPNTVDMFQ